MTWDDVIGMTIAMVLSIILMWVIYPRMFRFGVSNVFTPDVRPPPTPQACVSRKQRAPLRRAAVRRRQMYGVRRALIRREHARKLEAEARSRSEKQIIERDITERQWKALRKYAAKPKTNGKVEIVDSDLPDLMGMADKRVFDTLKTMRAEIAEARREEAQRAFLLAHKDDPVPTMEPVPQ